MLKRSCLFRVFAFTPLRIAALVMSVIVLPLYVSCSGKKDDGLRYGFMSEPATLDPLNPSNTADGRSLLFNVFEGLVKPDTEGGLRPCIAESVTIGEGLVYDFDLRKNVLFHDGSPLTSADVKYSIETAVTAGFSGLAGIENIETDGDYGVRIILKNPDPDFLPFLTVGIVKAGSTNRERNAIGTGPYYVESYAVQQSLVLRKFDGYWRDNGPLLDKITVVFFEDTDALVLGLRGGGIDGAGLTAALAQQLDPGLFDIVPGRSAMVQLLALNNAAEPFNDIRIRQALNFGIDIREIIDTAFYGRGEPSGSPLIPGLRAYYEQSLADPYPYDPEKARQLLAEAGYGEGGKKLSFEITVPSVFTPHIDTAQVIVTRLAQIGIDAGIRLVDWPAWLSDVYRDRKYQATIISLDSPVVSPAGFLSRYRSESDTNFINFSNAQFDRVFNEAAAEPDEGRRIELYREAQRVISANAASVYIQDILWFQTFRAGTYGGVLNYPIYVIDFAAIYAK